MLCRPAPAYRTVANLSGFDELSSDDAFWVVDGMRSRVYASQKYMDHFAWKGFDDPVYYYPSNTNSPLPSESRDISLEYGGRVNLPQLGVYPGILGDGSSNLEGNFPFALDAQRNRMFYLDHGGYLGCVDISPTGTATNPRTISNLGNDSEGGQQNLVSGSMILDQTTGRIGCSWSALAGAGAGNGNLNVLRVLHASPQNDYAITVRKITRPSCCDPSVWPGTFRKSPNSGFLCFTNHRGGQVNNLMSVKTDQYLTSSSVAVKFAEYWRSVWSGAAQNDVRFGTSSVVTGGGDGFFSNLTWIRACGIGLVHNYNGQMNFFRMLGDGSGSVEDVVTSAQGSLNLSTVGYAGFPGEFNIHGTADGGEFCADPVLPYVYMIRRRGYDSFGSIASSSRLAVWDFSDLADAIYGQNGEGLLAWSPSLVRYMGSFDLPFHAQFARVDHHNGKMYLERKVSYPPPPGPNSGRDVKYLMELDLPMILNSLRP